MKRMLPLTALAVLLLPFAMVRPVSAEAAGPKVTICHVLPGNPGKARTTTVAVNALRAHLAHGDTLGPCFDPF